MKAEAADDSDRRWRQGEGFTPPLDLDLDLFVLTPRTKPNQTNHTEQVHLCGSFTRWVETVPMAPSPASAAPQSGSNNGGSANELAPTEFSVVVHLPPGYHQYKFIVDGAWRHDDSAPFMPDPLGNVNNWLFVRRAEGGSGAGSAGGVGGIAGTPTTATSASAAAAATVVPSSIPIPASAAPSSHLPSGAGPADVGGGAALAAQAARAAQFQQQQQLQEQQQAALLLNSAAASDVEMMNSSSSASSSAEAAAAAAAAHAASAAAAHAHATHAAAYQQQQQQQVAHLLDIK